MGIQRTLLVLCLMFSFSAQAGISKQSAQQAKERMASCQFNDSVCVGNILIDALAGESDANLPSPVPDPATPNPVPSPGNGESNQPEPGRQNLVLNFTNTDTCEGTILSTLILGNNLQRNLQVCSNLDSQNKGKVWSIQLNGKCIDLADTTSRGACLQAVSLINAGGATRN